MGEKKSERTNQTHSAVVSASGDETGVMTGRKEGREVE